jgi:hypothetical protein
MKHLLYHNKGGVLQMNDIITLKEAIEGVLSCQRENGHPE